MRSYVLPVREAAVQEFARQHPGVRFAPVVVVIAGLNEADCIGQVLRDIPANAGGLAIETLVVDDGSTDGTGTVAAGFERVYVARLERNCGHGVALRLGYELARRGGAKYIVTLDADGQWEAKDIPVMLEPLLAGEADFVLGSRVLGSAETDDTFRQAGVHFFARLISMLTGVKVTDTSTGFRAMRAEITERVRQVQVQYQTSELLIGAIYAGYRITERPTVMHKRLAGESKKGRNLLYGLRYARVIMQTWLRERRPTRERAAQRRLADRESGA
jgi:glycosyltransferase involved in cell wall biosynthesis